MRLFTLIVVTFCLLIASVSFAQTSFTDIKNVESNELNMANTTGSITFNPIGIAKGIVKVKMFNQPTGNYRVQIIDAAGKILASKEIYHTDNKTLEIADFGKNFAGGTYQVEMINPDNKKTDQTIMLLI
jgi:hypothetical protein